MKETHARKLVDITENLTDSMMDLIMDLIADLMMVNYCSYSN